MRKRTKHTHTHTNHRIHIAKCYTCKKVSDIWHRGTTQNENMKVAHLALMSYTSRPRRQSKRIQRHSKYTSMSKRNQPNQSFVYFVQGIQMWSILLAISRKQKRTRQPTMTNKQQQKKNKQTTTTTAMTMSTHKKSN